MVWKKTKTICKQRVECDRYWLHLKNRKTHKQKPKSSEFRNEYVCLYVVIRSDKLIAPRINCRFHLLLQLENNC